jgi:5'-deoxynucleotidase YfbR-like HD superfamily hydrolase
MTDTPHIATYTGKLISCLDPRPEDIDIGDIAHALSLICRFNGHCNRFYSVAEHSVRVSVLAAELAESESLAEHLVTRAALLGLMHDAAEAYPPGDLAGPVKRYLRGEQQRSPVFDMQERFFFAIDNCFGLSPKEVKGQEFTISSQWADTLRIVKEADKMLLAWEWRDVMGRDPMWEIAAPHTTKQIQPWTSTSAELRFLLRFQQLVPGYPLADTIKRLLPMPEPAMMSKSMCTGAARDETIRLHLVLGEAERVTQSQRPAPPVVGKEAKQLRGGIQRLIENIDDGDDIDVASRLQWLLEDVAGDTHEEAEQIGFSVQIAGKQVEVAVDTPPVPEGHEVASEHRGIEVPGHMGEALDAPTEQKTKKKRKKRRKKRKRKGNGFDAAVQAAIDQAVAQALGSADITPKRGSPGSAENPREVPEQKSLKPTKAERKALEDPDVREGAFDQLPDRPTGNSSASGASFSRRPG